MRSSFVAIGLTVIAVAIQSAAAQDQATAQSTTGDMTVEVGQVPPAVLMVANRHVPGFKLNAADVDLGEDGMLVYEVAGTDADGKNVEIDVHPDGGVDEIEYEIDMSQVPENVTTLMKAYLADFQPTKIERSERPDLTTVYEFEGSRGGRDIDVEVSANGDRIMIVDDQAA